jgi:hypothetical protein
MQYATSLACMTQALACVAVHVSRTYRPFTQERHQEWKHPLYLQTRVSPSYQRTLTLEINTKIFHLVPSSPRAPGLLGIQVVSRRLGTPLAVEFLQIPSL